MGEQKRQFGFQFSLLAIALGFVCILQSTMSRADLPQKLETRPSLNNIPDLVPDHRDDGSEGNGQSAQQDKTFSFSGRSQEYRKAIHDLAFSLKGKPYRWNASGPNEFDCSGFVWYVLRTILGEQRFPLPYLLPKTERRAQSVYYRDFLAAQNAAVPCERSEIGDIVFFPESKTKHNHIGFITNPQRNYFITDQAKGVGVAEGMFGPGSYWADRPAQCYKNIWIY